MGNRDEPKRAAVLRDVEESTEEFSPLSKAPSTQ